PMACQSSAVPAAAARSCSEAAACSLPWCSRTKGRHCCERSETPIAILGHVRDALTDLLPGISCTGTSDVAAAGFKFSGNAQQRKRDHLLHHGTLLYAFDIERIGRYLRSPARQPEYRAKRDHGAFVRNLPADASGLKQRLREAWSATSVADAWPSERLHQLLDEKYAKPEWHRRR